MAKRHTAPQQRRRCPDFQRPRPERNRSQKPRPEPSGSEPGAPLRARGKLPRLPKDQDLSALFNKKTVQQSFAEMVESSLNSPAMLQALQEKRSSRQSRRRSNSLREYPPPQSDLDLHGLSGPEAEQRIAAFLCSAGTQGLRTVRIITGRGLHSKGPAVLPLVAEHQLRELVRQRLVAAYRWENKRQEKSGAVIAYLR